MPLERCLSSGPPYLDSTWTIYVQLEYRQQAVLRKIEIVVHTHKDTSNSMSSNLQIYWARTLAVLAFVFPGFILQLSENSTLLLAQEVKETKAGEPEEPRLAAASDEGTKAISTFRLDKRLDCQLFAAEPDVGNPVALFVDHDGRVYVCETYRQEKGVEDNRAHREWLNDDLAAQTVADRIAYMKKHLGKRYEEYTRQDDRIRLLIDSDGDGKSDKATVFANGFNEAEMGTGAGVLAYRGDVFYTCIPDLFLLRDNNRDGVAETRKSLQSGYGVRFAFRGHDMHGLIIGPDGRLYFSIGDRGYHINDKIKDPASGAVFRCDLDGSNLEVFATGLRNPQELAFDDYGNLFTGDNNSDSGDKARWVYVVRGGDSGWRMYYQYLSDRGPFNREKIWYPYNDDTPAYIVPPIANVGDGPSGLTYYPGTGFGDLFKNQFLLCDFRGNASNSGIRAIEHEPDGAFFKLKKVTQPIWQTLATDIDFGPDGKLYMADWVFGWVGENKGRIYTLEDKSGDDQMITREVQSLLGGELQRKSILELGELLSHRDRRIRQEAQFELVRKKAGDLLFQVAESTTQPVLARIHAIWGIGQLARSPVKGYPVYEDKYKRVADLADDDQVEVRVQAIRFLDDMVDESRRALIEAKLKDPSARVRYFAALALGKLGNVNSIPVVATMLEENQDRDPVLRHGGIMAWLGIVKRYPDAAAKLLEFTSPGSSESCVVAATVTLRKLGAKSIASFLDSSADLEAARGIYDTPIREAIPELASRLNGVVTRSEHFLGRALYANRWLGQAENARAISQFAANNDMPVGLRIQAIQILKNWGNPASADPFMGQWRPLAKRDVAVAAAALKENVAFIAGAEQKVRDELVSAIGALKIENADQLLTSVIESSDASDQAIVSALSSLHQLNSPQAKPMLEKMAGKFSTLSGVVAEKVLELWLKSDPESAIEAARKELLADQNLTPAKAQGLVRGLQGNLGFGKTKRLLVDLFVAAGEEKLAPEARLDLVMVALKSEDAEVQKAVADYQADLASTSDPLRKYADTLAGGDVERGSKVFFGKTEVSCVRCHKVSGVGGEVGPDLSVIGKDKSRQYLLESIVMPNKVIAKGFAQTIVMTVDGELKTGIVKEETDDLLVLMDAEGNLIKIPQDDIEETKMGLSSMPADLIDKLTMAELRDLVAYLKAQVEDTSGDGHQ